MLLTTPLAVALAFSSTRRLMVTLADARTVALALALTLALTPAIGPALALSLALTFTGTLVLTLNIDLLVLVIAHLLWQIVLPFS